MRVLLSTLLFFYLATLCYSTEPSIWPYHFGRHAWGSAIVAEEWLFIDGGEVYTTAPRNGTFSILNSTIAIDISVSWTNTTLTPIALAKPQGYPLARAQSIWYDPSTKRIFTRGGWRYETDNCEYDAGGYLCSSETWTFGGGYSVIPNFQSRPAQSMWQLQLGNTHKYYFLEGHRVTEWVQSPFASIDLFHQPPSDSGIPFGALQVSTPETYYSLGACMPFPDNGPAYAYPGLLELNLQTGRWSNTSQTDYAYAGYGAFGQAIFAPIYGEKGVILFFGGYAPLQQLFSWGGDSDPLQPMAQISILDIASGKFFKQTATGDVPGPRWGFCGVGVQDSNGGGFDIFIHGGFATSQGEPYNHGYANIYVLSLPSFRWTQVPGSVASMRALHSCAVIGKRQLVVVGGIDATAEFWVDSPDPWENGIGIFDMAALRWSSMYDASAAPYARASSLSASNRANPYPSLWGNGVEKLFRQPSRNASAQNIVHTDTASGHGSETGAIAGGVVGGVLGLVFCAVICYLIMMRRNTQRKQEHTHMHMHEAEHEKSPEARWFIDTPEMSADENRMSYKRDNDYNAELNPLRISEISTSTTPRTPGMEPMAFTSEAQELEA